MTVSDTELIREAKAGNMSAFRELVYRYDRKVIATAMRYTCNSDDAKDIYQEVFIRVYKNFGKFEERSGFSTWLFRITTNVCLTYVSRNKNRRSVPIERNDDEGTSMPMYNIHDPHTPESSAFAGEIGRQISQSLEKLTPKLRMVFILKHYEGYKLREIAEMMNCKEGTVKKYLFEAVAKLRSDLRPLMSEL